jgi:Mg2+/Co2+ transporter CorB
MNYECLDEGTCTLKTFLTYTVRFVLKANSQLQSQLDESSSSLEDTKSYVQQLQSLTNEERRERQRYESLLLLKNIMSVF